MLIEHLLYKRVFTAAKPKQSLIPMLKFEGEIMTKS